ncbi:MAG: ubiquinone/menaquinone biosynthesis methyltransferase [Candidatus Promineifilaceae bacterium]
MTNLTGEQRSRYVQTMFARIAGRYDLMNRLMTAGQDSRWRRVVVQRAQLPPDGRLLDVGTGTGDIAREGLRGRPGLLAVGADFTLEMMRIGRGDPGRLGIDWTGADTLALPFPDASFQAVTSGFLMRNVADVAGAFREQVRVTVPGGWIVVLESSPPKDNPLRPFIRFHLNTVIPLLGRLVAGDAEAYRYLPESTQGFQDPESLAKIMLDCGLVDVSYELFMFGTVAIHSGRKTDELTIND